RRHADFLSHGHSAYRDFRPGRCRLCQTFLFARQIDACRLAEAKSLDVACKPVLAQSQAELDGPDIRGILKNLLNRQQTERFPIVNTVPIDNDRSQLTVDQLLEIDQVLFERYPHRQDLEYRTRFISQRYRAIDPVNLLKLTMFVRIKSR